MVLGPINPGMTPTFGNGFNLQPLKAALKSGDVKAAFLALHKIVEGQKNEISSLSEKTGLTRAEILKLDKFISANKSRWKKQVFIRKEDSHLPRSIIYIPGEGTVVLLKTKGKLDALGTGMEKSVKQAMCWETGEILAFATPKKGKVLSEKEFAINRELKKVDKESKHLLTGRDVHYTGKDKNKKVGFLMKKAPTTLDKIESTLTPADRLKIIQQLANGYALINKSGYVYRDIKLENIFVLAGNEVRIGDFGKTHKVGDTHMETGSTYGYMAPEMFENEKANPASDVFSFGLLLAELMEGIVDPFGQYAFDKVDALPDSEKEKARSILIENIKAAHGDNLENLKDAMDLDLSETKDSIQRLIYDCCQFNVSDRPPSMIEVAERLNKMNI